MVDSLKALDPKRPIREADIRTGNFWASIFLPRLGQANAPGGTAPLPRTLKSRTILFEIVLMLPVGLSKK